MKTVLIIAADPAARAAWGLALRKRGMICRPAPTLLGALDDTVDPNVVAIVFEPDGDDDLLALAALSSARSLPPVVVVPSRQPEAPITTRMMAVTLVAPGTPRERALERLTCLMRGRSLSSPTNLPVRLSSLLEAQWTMRLSAVPYHHDEDGFDGATHPDGFDLAARL